jgi:hypothetical protein
MASTNDELREKIKSKMEVGKFFAGFITFLIGFLLKDLSTRHLFAKIGIVCLAASIGFCIAAVFAFDSLLMPRKYWGFGNDEGAEERFADKVQPQMVHLWQVLFVPAVFCFGLGFTFTLIETLGLYGGTVDLAGPTEGILLVVLLAVAIALPVTVGHRNRPRITD